MKKEYIVIFSVGLIILAYVLDAIVNPLALSTVLPTPYHYFTKDIITTYAFTFTSVFLKALAIFLSLPTILAALDLKPTLKGIILLICSGLLQLYAVQDVATKAQVVPIEWSLAFTLSGVFLLFPALLFMLIGFFSHPKKSSPLPAPETH